MPQIYSTPQTDRSLALSIPEAVSTQEMASLPFYVFAFPRGDAKDAKTITSPERHVHRAHLSPERRWAPSGDIGHL